MSELLRRMIVEYQLSKTEPYLIILKASKNVKN